MSTEAQIAANKANAQHSTGPKTPAGKAASSANHIRHGFTGEFRLLSFEDPQDYEILHRDLVHEHKPSTPTEQILVERMAQHQFLLGRALKYQTAVLELSGKPAGEKERSLALYLRYQTVQERAFSKCLNDLLKLRAEKRKAEIGFESQKRLAADTTRKEVNQTIRQNNENRQAELHKFQVWLAEAKAEHQEVLTMNIETPETRIPNRFERISGAPTSRLKRLKRTYLAKFALPSVRRNGIGVILDRGSSQLTSTQTPYFV